MKTHILGFSRIGINRELKFSLENYWNNMTQENEKKLIKLKQIFCKNNWENQKNLKLDYITLGDFHYYDHILTTLIYFNCIPIRFNFNTKNISLKEYFELAKGNNNNQPLEMTKWFNTNYHYLIPEYDIDTKFSNENNWLINDIILSKNLNYPIKVILVGPLTLLKLGKIKDNKLKNRLLLLPDLLLNYINFIEKINSLNINIIQIEEPILSLDLSPLWKICLKNTYKLILSYYSNILLTSYFCNSDIFNDLTDLQVMGFHINIYSKKDIKTIKWNFIKAKIISIGIISGRDIWKNNLEKSYYILKEIPFKIKNTLISTTCSLMHVPIDLYLEKNINKNIKNWLSFGIQKIKELNLLKNLLIEKFKIIPKDFIKNIFFIENKKKSKLIYNKKIQKIFKNINKYSLKHRSKYNKRKKHQYNYLNLPLLPTTTIGSFPQTEEIRKYRFLHKKKKINTINYENFIKKEISNLIEKQIKYNLDVFVHGEYERNDMVEYFSDYFDGMINTSNGWIQSYGARYVKPPIIYGDIYMEKFITNKWIKYSQNLTNKPVKGMLTGPLTLLKWSFPRNDIPNYISSFQFSFNIKEEILNLEKFNIKIIQLDEPALKEALPLKKGFYKKYFNWSIKSFLISSNKVKKKTQIHTHICYSEFEKIIKFISKLDADVISIETSRSNFEILPYLLNYTNSIGLGIYDIHSKRSLNINKAIYLIKLIISNINEKKIWINPDCGLKTRDWIDIEAPIYTITNSTNIIRKCINF